MCPHSEGIFYYYPAFFRLDFHQKHLDFDQFLYFLNSSYKKFVFKSSYRINWERNLNSSVILNYCWSILNFHFIFKETYLIVETAISFSCEISEKEGFYQLLVIQDSIYFLDICDSSFRYSHKFSILLQFFVTIKIKFTPLNSRERLTEEFFFVQYFKYLNIYAHLNSGHVF